MGPAFDVLARELSDAGLAPMHLPGKDTAGSLYARPSARASGQPVQLLLGHVDTVWPLGTLARMPVVRSDGKIRGPGVFDMKAGLTSFVIALQVLSDLNLSLPAAPAVLITSDEEIGSQESRRHIERLARCASRVYVTEPGLGHRGKIKTARKGTGEYVIYVSDATSSGSDKAGASSQIVPQMMNLVQGLHDLSDPDRGITVNVGTLRGPGTNADPEEGAPRGSLGVDVRVVTKEDAYAVDQALRTRVARLLKGTGVTADIRGGVERPPLERTPENRASGTPPSRLPRKWICLWRKTGLGALRTVTLPVSTRRPLTDLEPLEMARTPSTSSPTSTPPFSGALCWRFCSSFPRRRNTESR